VTEIACYVHGSFPRSEELVAATRDADRGRRPASAVAAQRDLDRAGFLALQAEAGLDYQSSGWLSWADLFRPLIEACPGLATGPLTRWFDTNTFFRAPIAAGPLELDRAAFAARLAGDLGPAGTGGNQLGLLPGPYTFSRLAEPDTDRDALMPRLARELLRPAAEELRDAGATLLHLQEPALVTRPVGMDSWRHLDAALRLITDDLGVRVVVHGYYGDAGPLVTRLRELPVDAVGVDLTETDVDSLRGPWPVGLLAGCLDGRSSRLESAAATVALARRILEIAQPPVLFLSSGGDLELLPRAVAEQKVRVLGAATRQLREELGC
jgi:5-methyltetrahydropteroyltriglutamate--homocysteine methyltransferase